MRYLFGLAALTLSYSVFAQPLNINQHLTTTPPPNNSTFTNAVVVHFNPNTLSWDTTAQSISGMKNIGTVITAGLYSWAIGSSVLQGGPPSLVSFHDAAPNAQWTPAAAIPGMATIFSITPGDSSNGSNIAFAEGVNADFYPVISVFNNQTWSQAQVIGTKNSLGWIVASNNTAWLLNSNDNFKTWDVMKWSSTTGTWSAPAALPISSIATTSISANGEMYILNLSANKSSQEILQQAANDPIDAWKISQKVTIDHPAKGNDVAALAASGKNVFFNSFSDATHAKLYFSPDMGVTWYAQSYPGNFAHTSPYALVSLTNGSFCGISQTQKTIWTQLGCFDINQSNPQWALSQIPNPVQNQIQGDALALSSDSTEAWFTPQAPGGQALVYYYDLNLNKWNTSLPQPPASSIVDGVPLNNGRFIAAANQTVLYYDGTQWTSTTPSGVTVFSNLSQNGMPYGASISNPANNVWAIGWASTN